MTKSCYHNSNIFICVSLFLLNYYRCYRSDLQNFILFTYFVFNIVIHFCLANFYPSKGCLGEITFGQIRLLCGANYVIFFVIIYPSFQQKVYLSTFKKTSSIFNLIFFLLSHFKIVGKLLDALGLQGVPIVEMIRPRGDRVIAPQLGYYK